MSRTTLFAVVCLIGINLAQPLAAEEDPFVVRFGFLSVNPTSDSVVMGQRNELRRAYGMQGSFEWYFAERVGLEGSAGWAFDADVEADGDVFTGVSILPLCAGINFHPIRTPKVDWGVGVLVGALFYSDFTFVDTGNSSINTVDSDVDLGFGAQTFLDIGFGETGNWGANFGVKWIDADYDFSGQPLPVDPLIVTAGARFRF
jgi:outer membrane protein W